LLNDFSVRQHGHLVWITGPAGCGKSALARNAAEQAAQKGALVLRAVASGQDVPFDLVAQLFASAVLPPEITKRAADLFEQPHLPAGPTDQESPGWDAITRTGGKAARLMLDLARHRPLVLLINDAQHADPYSLQVVTYLARRLATSPMLIYVTESDPALPPTQWFRDTLLRQPGCHSLRLAPLSEQGVEALLRLHLGPSAARRLAAEGYTRSGGSPRLLTALIMDTRQYGGGSLRRLVFGHAYRQAVRGCLRACGSAESAVAQTLALLDERRSTELVGDAANLGPASTSQVMELLETIGLLRDGGFRTEAARMAVLEGLDPMERSVACGRVAAALHRYGASGHVLAQYLLDAGGVELPWVVPVLREAAQVAVAQGCVALAIRFLHRALRDCTDTERASITSDIMRAQWQVDPWSASQYLPELIEHMRQGRLVAHDCLVLIDQLLWHGRVRDAVDMTDLLAARADSHGDAPDPDIAGSWLAWTYPDLCQWEDGQWGASRDEAMPAGSDRVGTLSADPFLDRPRRGLGDQRRPSLDVMGRWQPGGGVLASFASAVATILAEERVDGLVPENHEIARNASGLREGTSWALSRVVRALIQFRRGNLTAAKKEIDDGLYALSPTAWGVAIGAAVATALLIATAAGLQADASEYLSIPVPAPIFDGPFGLFYLYARGRFCAATESYDLALGDFETCGAMMRRWSVDLPGLIPWRSEAALVLLQLDRRDEAASHTAEQLALLEPGRSRARGITLRAHALTKPIRQQREPLRAAAEILWSAGEIVELIETFSDLARMYAQLGEQEQAEACARKVRYLIDRTSAALPANEPADEWPATDGRERLYGLTDSEHRVATLAVREYTNRQIAGRLNITISTVEQHLTRVYRKLRINRRADLPLELGWSTNNPI
jgi:DNA-binding CsgD family transcriptional regulator